MPYDRLHHCDISRTGLEFPGSHFGGYEDGSLLGSDAVYTGRSLLMFPINLLAPRSGYSICTLEDRCQRVGGTCCLDLRGRSRKLEHVSGDSNVPTIPRTEHNLVDRLYIAKLPSAPVLHNVQGKNCRWVRREWVTRCAVCTVQSQQRTRTMLSEVLLFSLGTRHFYMQKP
jgi:hypothetical protein